MVGPLGMRRQRGAKSGGCLGAHPGAEHSQEKQARCGALTGCLCRQVERSRSKRHIPDIQPRAIRCRRVHPRTSRVEVGLVLEGVAAQDLGLIQLEDPQLDGQGTHQPAHERALAGRFMRHSVHDAPIGGAERVEQVSHRVGHSSVHLGAFREGVEGDITAGQRLREPARVPLNELGGRDKRH